MIFFKVGIPTFKAHALTKYKSDLFSKILYEWIKFYPGFRTVPPIGWRSIDIQNYSENRAREFASIFRCIVLIGWPMGEKCVFPSKFEYRSEFKPINTQQSDHYLYSKLKWLLLFVVERWQSIIILAVNTNILTTVRVK